MKLSIIVIFHDMRREAARTLFALSTLYQTGIDPDSYEVIALDNGSRQPLDGDLVRSFGPNFAYRFFDTSSPSPVEAVNFGADIATGDLIAVIVDGARMPTPGLVAQTIQAAQPFDEPFVCGLSWHIGPDLQNRSILEGYDQSVEDGLLDRISWRENGYDLFVISTIAASSNGGFLAGVPPECSWFCMRRSRFLGLGGFDARFRTPGGGLANHDFRDRALAVSELTPIVLLSEGVFHQFHGGVATNVRPEDHPMQAFRKEYREIRGVDYRQSPSPPVYYFGGIRVEARRFL